MSCPLARVAAVGALGLPAAAAEGDDAGDDTEWQQQQAHHPRAAARAILNRSLL